MLIFENALFLKMGYLVAMETYVALFLLMHIFARHIIV